MKSLAHYAVRGGSVAAALITLAGCAVAPPSGPQVMALPGSGKTYEQFTAENWEQVRSIIFKLDSPDPDLWPGA